MALAGPVLADGKVEIVCGDWAFHTGFLFHCKLLDEYPAAFVLAGFEIFPLSLDKVVGLQFRVGLDLPDTHFPENLIHAVHQDGIGSRPAIFRFDRHQVQVGPVVLLEGIQQVDKTEREKPPVAFLQRPRKRRQGDPKGDHLILLVVDHRHEIRRDKTKILRNIGIHLFGCQRDSAIQVLVFIFKQLEQLFGMLQEFFLIP